MPQKCIDRRGSAAAWNKLHDLSQYYVTVRCLLQLNRRYAKLLTMTIKLVPIYGAEAQTIITREKQLLERTEIGSKTGFLVVC